MGIKTLKLLVLSFCLSQSFNTIKLIEDQKEYLYYYDEENKCYVSTESSSKYICSSDKYEQSWELFKNGQIVDGLVLSLKDGIPTLYMTSNDQRTEIDKIKAEFIDTRRELLTPNGKHYDK